MFKATAGLNTEAKLSHFKHTCSASHTSDPTYVCATTQRKNENIQYITLIYKHYRPTFLSTASSKPQKKSSNWVQLQALITVPLILHPLEARHLGWLHSSFSIVLQIIPQRAKLCKNMGIRIRARFLLHKTVCPQCKNCH